MVAGLWEQKLDLLSIKNKGIIQCNKKNSQPIVIVFIAAKIRKEAFMNIFKKLLILLKIVAMKPN